jgi:molybdate transport system substrate-binding protein
MKRCILALFLVVLISGEALAREVTVFAAASLTDAFLAIKPAFESQHPGTTVVVNFASSGSLFRQLERGAPADVYASANPKWMDKAVSARMIDPSSVTTFARNSLVLAVPQANPAGITSLQDLSDSRVAMISLGNPKHVPAGQYARDALQKKGLWESLGYKFIMGETVRQVLDYLKRGEVDCGFVYGTDALKGGNRITVIEEIPLDRPVTYPIARVAQAMEPEIAKALMDFITGPQGSDILQANGFKKP